MILQRRRKRDSFLPFVQLIVDCITIQLVLRACFWFRFTSSYFPRSLSLTDQSTYFKAFTFFMILIILFLRFYRLYRPAAATTFSDETANVLKSVTMSTFLFMALTFFFRDFSFSRTFYVLAGVALAVSLTLERFTFGSIIMLLDRKRGSFRNIVLLGYDANADKLIRFYQRNPRFSTKVFGILDDNLCIGEIRNGVPVVGKFSDLARYIQENSQIHEIVLVAQNLSNETVLKIIYDCEKEMVSFRWIADIFGLIASKMSVLHLGSVPVLSFSDSPLSDWENRFLKRGMDITLSLAGLIVTAPFFILISILIKSDSPGSIFYRQERVGEDGQSFMLLKFRTMQMNAETLTGPVWAQENDSRRTRLGAFLRENNLDELPQLWNVFAGDMSLVGPRPERPHFVGQFKEDIPRYMARHSIRSGLTGWAQVNGLRGNTSIEERTKFDLYYIENWSLFFDFKILAMTFFAKKNAY